MLNKIKSLQIKVLLISVCFFGLFSAINLLVEYYIVYPSFISLEQDEARKNLSRAAEAILNNISHLGNACHDWASWDDTYDFIQTRSDRYIGANLVRNTFENNKIHLICFFDTKGDIVWGEAYSDKYEQIHPAELNQGGLSPSHPFFSYDTSETPLSEANVRGIWISEFGPMLIASQPILTSESGGPVAGTLVMGRFLSKTLVKDLSTQAQAPFEIQPYGSDTVPPASRHYGKPAANGSPLWIVRQDEEHLSAYTVLSDIHGKQAIVVKATTRRDISAKGRTAIRYAVVSNFIGIIGILMVFVLILQQTVLKPITRLKDYILNFGAAGVLAPRFTVNRNDEIGTLGMEFDKLLVQLDGKAAELERLNDQLKRDQARLARSQKMEAIGLLAGGVAHDLNNVLSGISSYPELLLLDLPEKSPLRKPLLTIQKSGQKAAEIVQDLLALARRGVMDTQVFNLNTIVSDYLNSAECEKLLTYHPGTELSVSLSNDLPNIRGGPIHLKKTIMNLVSNAAEAQPAGGLIYVSTENQYLDSPLRGYDTIAAGDYVIVRVSDNGTGIDQEDIGRIFEPFYTKKVMGRSGTGLGMAVVWGTVQDHNGYIDIESTQGKGTVISLFFPVTREAALFSADTFRMEDFRGDGKSVLVVDDMEEQRLIASGILTKAGYRVETVSSGEEALRYLSKTAVDLVVLDMIMDSGMDGLSTYRKILEIHPGQRAIIASGFSETDRVKETLRLGAKEYLRKPYTLEKILRAAAAALKA